MHEDGLPFNEADIRHQIGIAKRLGVPREEMFCILTPLPVDRRAGSLTDIEIRRIFDDAWPVDSS